jgi:scyllo-inositol 2-dehydrogenase (NADP+)
VIRIGVLGAGWVANHRHLPVLTASKGVEVVALHDHNLEHATKSAGAFGVPVATDHLDEFFATEPSAVVVCSSPWSHHDLALAALDHGCHVLTEKPMAMNLEEARSMQGAADRVNRILCVSHNFLFSSAVRRAERLLGNSERRYVIGMQLSSDRRRLPSWYEELPAGLLFDELPHLLYMMQHFLGSLVLDSVRVSRRTERGHPATTEILVQGAHGPGQALVVSGAPVSEWHVSVVDQDRVVDLDLFRDIAVSVPPDGAHGAFDIMKTSSHVVAGHASGFVRSGLRLATRRLFWGHDVLIRSFVDAASGRADPPVAPSEALGVVALTDDILTALQGS